MAGKESNSWISQSENWEALIQAHPLEDHDPAAWLRYGVALLQTIEPGGEAGRQQQQAALAFLQAIKEGATASDVQCAQEESVVRSLEEALDLVGLGRGGLQKR
jgi:hypothetical protein